MRDATRILFPTDFSENSYSALPAAVALARQNNAEIHLLHVITPMPTLGLPSIESAGMFEVDDELWQITETRLREFAADVAEGIRVEIAVLNGPPADAIRDYVNTDQHDLVVLSTRGQTGVQRLMLGSTTEKIARTAPCPVLVVRPLPKSWDSISTIVVPTDFSADSKLAIREAVAIASECGAQLRLVHVIEETDYPMGGHVLKGSGILNIREQTQKATKMLLEDLQKELVGDAVRSNVVLREGPPASVLADFAEEHAADLIVLATHAREGLAHFVLGSTAERIVRVAPCSVLVVKKRTR